MRTTLNSKIASLLSSLETVEQVSRTLIGPVRFDGAAVTELPRMFPTATPSLFNALSLMISTNIADGLIFYLSDPNQADQVKGFLGLELIDGLLHFRFGMTNLVVTVISPVRLQEEKWYQINANRFGHEGTIKVTEVFSQRSHSAFGSQTTLDKYLLLVPNSTAYIGGIIENMQLDQAMLSRRNFMGCLHNISLDGIPFDVWKPQSPQESPNCCNFITSHEEEPSTTLGTSFHGFGYLSLPFQDFHYGELATLSLRFYTLASYGVLLTMAGTANSYDPWLLLLEEGHLTIQQGLDGKLTSKLVTKHPINLGHWHQVTITWERKNTSLQMDVFDLDLRQSDADSQVMKLAKWTEMTDGEFLFGALERNANSRLGWFSGCVSTFQHSNGSKQRKRKLSDSTDYTNVSPDTCLQTVEEGIHFYGVDSYIQLNITQPQNILETFELTFKTKEVNGILFVTRKRQEELLYVALFGGNIFAIFAGEDDPGQLIYLYTVNESLSDAQWHTILLNFTGKFASLQVNDHATVASRKEYVFPAISLAQEGLLAFVGGASADIVRVIKSDHRFPGTVSFKGDIRGIKINSKSVDYYKPTILMSARSVSSAGVSPPPTQASPLPIVSSLPRASSCSLLDLFIDPAGVQIGLNAESFLQYHVDTTLQRHLLSSFVISMKFRTHAADGILCFVAESLTDPRSYVALYLVDGYIEFKVSTEKADAQTFTVSSIITKFRYNNGQWWEVMMLRINDFLAIVNTERRDYTNNQASSSQVTYIRLQGSQTTPFYVGGVPRGLLQQSQGFELPSGFQGCIQKLEISANQDIPAVNVLLLTSELAVGTGPCFTAVTEGAFFQGHGYIHLGKFAANEVIISLSIKTHQRSGLFLQFLEPSSDTKLSVGFQEGQIAVSMFYNLSPLPVIKSSLLNSYRICDNKPHRIEIRLLENVGFEILMDKSILLASPMPVAFFKEIMNMDVYFGGAPDLHSPAKIPGFTGCILSMFINGKETSLLSDTSERINVSRGCPS